MSEYDKISAEVQMRSIKPVSYTHLDVYKRQAIYDAGVKEISRNGVDEKDGFIWPSYVEDIMYADFYLYCCCFLLPVISDIV